jgi:hypothetical protein
MAESALLIATEDIKSGNGKVLVEQHREIDRARGTGLETLGVDEDHFEGYKYRSWFTAVSRADLPV